MVTSYIYSKRRCNHNLQVQSKNESCVTIGFSMGVALIVAALNRPIDKYTYDTDCTIFQLAAAYSFGLGKNHPFVDGNKRVAFMAGTLFLELNGYDFAAEESDAAFVFEKLAAGKIKEPDLAIWLEQNVS